MATQGLCEESVPIFFIDCSVGEKQVTFTGAVRNLSVVFKDRRL
jgi:hypothetical protein